jgi:GNAT superfamily N-acetyltransferase
VILKIKRLPSGGRFILYGVLVTLLSGMIRFPLRIVQATTNDADFLKIAIREAERAHTGIGLYDCLVDEEIVGGRFNHDDAVAEMIKFMVLYEPNSIFYYKRFLIGKPENSEQNIACVTAFPYPEYGVECSIPSFCRSMMEVFSCSEELVKKSWDRCSFMKDAFPDVNCDGTWMIDAVYTDKNFRGHGIASSLVQEAMKLRYSHDLASYEIFTRPEHPSSALRPCMLSCIHGNDRAKSLYESLGFKVQGGGAGYSEECLKYLHTEGFYLMKTKE